MREIQLSVWEKDKIKEQGDLFGIFFEDLNHAADGGLYGEMVQNRSFEFDRIDNKNYHAMIAWEEVQRGDSVVQTHIEQRDPRNPVNPHYLVIESLTEGEGAGVRNEGYNTGLFIEEGKEYLFTCFCRARENKEGSFEARLENKEGSRVYASQILRTEAGRWTKVECRLKPDGTDAAARLVLLMTQPMTLELDTVSLFPAETYKGRKNGLRRDIAEMIGAMKPRFMRFPGGCLTHIGSLNARDRNAMYCWKNTLGEVWERPSKKNSWEYNQTLGLGFYEFFLFCEDIGAEPMPVISAGYDPHFLRFAAPDEMEEWIDEALDLIEFANGGIETKWGKIRADMGHPDSFHLKYLAVGNEEVGDEYFERYEIILDKIKAVYPDIQVINSAGPSCAGSEFDKGWAQAERTKTSFVDEHFYQCPEWFIANARRYESYHYKAKAFLGEYASQDMTWRNALAESAFMIGMEKAEGIGLACYAPLLNNVDYTNWKADMIHYDNHRVYGTPSYYVQKLFMNYQGERLVRAEADISPVKKNGPKLHGRIRFAVTQAKASIADILIRNEDTGEIIRPKDVSLGGDKKEQYLADVAWDHYTISFRYRRDAGGTAETLRGSHVTSLEFAMADEQNCLHLLLDGWERTVALNGMVDGFSCSMGMSRLVLERGVYYPCSVEVSGSHVRAVVNGCVLEHECISPEPEELYYSAVTDEEDNLIVKLSNVTAQKKHIRIRPQDAYRNVRKIFICGCDPEWRNSFEEPEKVAPKEEEEPAGTELVYEVPEYSLTILKFIR